MHDTTCVFIPVKEDETQAADQLFPLVYDELRRLAAYRLARERPGQTLEATALVNEAYLRLVGPAGDRRWDSRGHFFAAAAQAMRRILVENARRKGARSTAADGGREHADLDAIGGGSPPKILALHDVLSTRLPSTTRSRPSWSSCVSSAA